MALPQTKDLQAYRWATLKHRFHAVKDDQTPQDLTGYSAVMQIRADPGGALLDELSEGGGLDTDATGHVDVYLSQSETGEASWDTGFYDLFLVDGQGNRYAFVTGGISIHPSVADFG